jgi:hypothetical protein
MTLTDFFNSARRICGLLILKESFCTVYSVHRNHMEGLNGITPEAYQTVSTPYHELMWSHQPRTMT